mmetsp:Transcript_9490/g.57883  ORF Transcript_9490/g.57883 Transcript_9490/m.57883 type:complete len:204 (-) Transcript_9490:462-1073(-)
MDRRGTDAPGSNDGGVLGRGRVGIDAILLVRRRRCAVGGEVAGRLGRRVPEHEVLLLLKVHGHVELVGFLHGQEVELVSTQIGVPKVLGIAGEIQVRIVRRTVRTAGGIGQDGRAEVPAFRARSWFSSRMDADLVQGDGRVLAQVECGVSGPVLLGFPRIGVGCTRLSEGLYLPHHVLGLVQHDLLLPLVDDDHAVDQEGDHP